MTPKDPSTPAPRPLSQAPAAWRPSLERLLAARHLWLVTHENPDPDGLGAMLALAEGLERLGRKCRCFAPHEVPETYRFFRGWERIEQANARRPPTGSDPDLVVLVDANQAHRVGAWPRGKTALSVDHHLLQEDSIPGIVEPSRSSASELVYELLETLGVELTPAMAHNLYAGLLFDTRSFRYIQGRPGALRVGAALVALGVDTEAVFDALFASYPSGFLRLSERFLSELRFDLDGRLAWGVVSVKEARELGVPKTLIHELLPFMLMVGEVRVAILYRVLDNGQFKASLRSKGRIDVQRIAALHGGGGHRNASGVALDLAPEEHVRVVRPLIQEAIRADARRS